MVVAVNKTLPDGMNYKRWLQKLLIFFEQLEVDYVLITEFPSKNETSQTLDETKEKLQKDNKTIRGHLLNHVKNLLFDSRHYSCD